MIDIVPNAAAAQQANAGNGPIPIPAGASGASTTLGSNADATTSTSAQQPASFASTLHNRLKLMALNKSASVAPLAINLPLSAGKDTGLVDTGRQAATLVAPGLFEAKNDAVKTPDPLATKDDAVEATDNAKPGGDAEITPILPLPTMPPLALNTIAMSPVPAAAQAAAPLAAAPASRTLQDNLLESASANPVAEPVTTAILAVESEKTALTTANRDSKNENLAFQDALSNRLGPANNHPQPAGNMPSVAREVQAPFASAHWATDVGNQLSWMANTSQSRADLVLNPPQLGRIEVSITMIGDQASASFVSANPEVRDALQGSLPRLREVLADAGVFLGQASIGAESFNQNQNGAEKGGKSPDDSFSSAGQPLLGSMNRPLSIPSAQTAQGRGLIDLFA